MLEAANSIVVQENLTDEGFSTIFDSSGSIMSSNAVALISVRSCTALKL